MCEDGWSKMKNDVWKGDGVSGASFYENGGFLNRQLLQIVILFFKSKLSLIIVKPLTL